MSEINGVVDTVAKVVAGLAATAATSYAVFRKVSGDNAGDRMRDSAQSGQLDTLRILQEERNIAKADSDALRDQIGTITKEMGELLKQLGDLESDKRELSQQVRMLNNAVRQMDGAQRRLERAKRKLSDFVLQAMFGLSEAQQQKARELLFEDPDLRESSEIRMTDEITEEPRHDPQ